MTPDGRLRELAIAHLQFQRLDRRYAADQEMFSRPDISEARVNSPGFGVAEVEHGFAQIVGFEASGA